MKAKETTAPYKAKKKHYTYEDYLRLPDDGNRYEIINGELITSPLPKVIHQIVSEELGFLFSSFVKAQKLGKIFYAPTDVVLDKFNTVQPDIFFISNENRKLITEDNIKGAPGLIVEILSPSTAYSDLVEKKELYEAFGVREYWIVDPKKERIDIFVLQKGKYHLQERAERTGKIQSVLLKGLSIDLAVLFSEEEQTKSD